MYKLPSLTQILDGNAIVFVNDQTHSKSSLLIGDTPNPHIHFLH